MRGILWFVVLGMVAVFGLPGLWSPVRAEMNPINFIRHQIQNPNMLVVLDTSGSMNGVPGMAFTNSSEVGVDCDNGINCRGWGLNGVCSETGRPCQDTGDCRVGYCEIGRSACGSNADCPSQGSCEVGNRPCLTQADCDAYGAGTCAASGDDCSILNSCPVVGMCNKTNSLCSNIGKRCNVGRCSNDANRICEANRDCTSSQAGVCEAGSTPSGGCYRDADCPGVGRCDTGENCSTSGDCPPIANGRCVAASSRRCSSNADCRTILRPNDTCRLSQNACTPVTNRCQVTTGTCKTVSSNTCVKVSNPCNPSGNQCKVSVQNACVPAPETDVCTVSASAGQGALKMCKISQALCNRDQDCSARAGDRCGPPTSRSVVAKRVLSRIIEENYSVVNFGFMTFFQKGYFPYYKVDGKETRYDHIFISKGHLDGPCFNEESGPTSDCRYKGIDYQLVPGKNSRYVVNHTGGIKTYHDVPWCGYFCQIQSEGTGKYEGSYYETEVRTGAITSNTPRVFSEYTAKHISTDGQAYTYYQSRSNYYNGGQSPPISVASCGNVCSASCGARWDDQLAPFLNPNASTQEARQAAHRILEWMAPASYGGLVMYGGTPSGCTLQNNSAQTVNASAYHYMAAVKNSDTLPCRQNFVLFITDGEANGPGDSNCTNKACAAADPEKAGCACRAVLAAWRLRRDHDVRTFVVGFSSDTTTGDARIINDNVARAGGTDVGNDGKTPFAFAANNEEELGKALQRAIYDAVSGSYSTAPATSSSGQQLSHSIKSGKYALDARVDFPSWEGHLLAYDVTQDPPRLAWDANVELKRMKWWERRIYVGTQDGSIVKVRIDPQSKIVINQNTLYQLGLGADEEEAGKMIRFAMGDPLMGNPAPLGSMINSTPIDVGQPGLYPLPGGYEFFNTHKDRPNLTYVGADDGMLHAFFTNETVVDGVVHPAGSEAFAFIPPGMLDVITKLYVQGGQVADPDQHIYGLANSPKVRNLCILNCTDAEKAIWKTLLVVNEGYGGNNMLMLDVTNPVSDDGFAEPPVQMLWHTQASHLAQQYTPLLGRSLSVPAFYFNKTDTLNDFRLVFAAGLPPEDGASGSNTQGRSLLVASAVDGKLLHVENPESLGSCVQPYAMVADVATARDHGVAEYKKLRAAYVGDTWGNLWRYTNGLHKVVGLGCDHPMHFAPTVVELDRDDPDNHAGLLYIVQVTNSALDDDTLAYPPSRMVIRRELATSTHTTAPDTNFGESGQIVLTAGKGNELCGVTQDDGQCAVPLPADARPTTTPTAILKRDGSGFQILSMWYQPDRDGCGKGATWLAIHEVIGDSVVQKQGLKVANEPVTSPVIAGGRIYIVGSEGTLEISGDLSSSFGSGTASPVADVGVGVYRMLGWTELE